MQLRSGVAQVIQNRSFESVIQRSHTDSAFLLKEAASLVDALTVHLRTCCCVCVRQKEEE